jgi:glutamate racemase
MSSGRIGVFDSGVGGLSVAGRLMQDAPDLAIHYYGDTAHVPYGDRPASEVTHLVETIVEHLVNAGAAAVVMACNTSNALALDRVRSWCPVPVVGIIDPAAAAAVMRTRNGRIGLIANPITAKSGAYEKACRTANGRLNFGVNVYPMGCPKLVPLIESGQVHTREARETLWEYLAPLQMENIDTLILGCTHYPWMRPLIQELLGPEVEIIDPAAYVLQELHRLGVTSTGASTHLVEVSGDPDEFARVGSRLLNRSLGQVQHQHLKRFARLAG